MNLQIKMEIIVKKRIQKINKFKNNQVQVLSVKRTSRILLFKELLGSILIIELKNLDFKRCMGSYLVEIIMTNSHHILIQILIRRVQTAKMTSRIHRIHVMVHQSNNNNNNNSSNRSNQYHSNRLSRNQFQLTNLSERKYLRLISISRIL